MQAWAIFAAVWVFAVSAFAGETLRVMTFNIWVGGESGGQPLSQTAKVIQEARADLAGLQETRGEEKSGARPDNGRRVADLLGWHYFDQGDGTGVASRHPILTNTPNKWGVLIRLPSGREVWMFNAHLMHAPYQPYQLLDIPYAGAPFIKTAAEAVSEAKKARGAQTALLLAELRPALGSGRPVFLTGDFNEPSHLDWTERAAKAGKCPVAVEYPASLAIVNSGMADLFRAVFPDETRRRGDTWTPTTRPDDPKDRHDRIDWILANPMVKAKRCEIVGETGEFADIVVHPYPSDHRAVVATVEIP